MKLITSRKTQGGILESQIVCIKSQFSNIRQEFQEQINHEIKIESK